MIHSIVRHLEEKGVKVISSNLNEITTCSTIGEREVRLFSHLPPLDGDIMTSLPSFYLEDRQSFGLLAHVCIGDPEHNRGLVCSGADDGLSLNFHNPEKVFFEAHQKALDTIAPVLLSEEKNHDECIEEFYGIWRDHCPIETPLLVLTTTEEGIHELSVKTPKRRGAGLSGKVIVTPSGETGFNHNYQAATKARSMNIQGAGVLIHATTPFLPPEPGEDIKCWWRNFLNSQSEALQIEVREFGRLNRAQSCWVVCHFKYKEQNIWFALSAKHKQKRKHKLPLSTDFMSGWDLAAEKLDVHHPNIILPRGGASTSINDKQVLVVGCGSIGSKVAVELVSSGIRSISLLDKDLFKQENLYRHVLGMEYLWWSKSAALANLLQQRFPFIKTSVVDEKGDGELHNLTDEQIASYDLIIIATGSATDDRVFNERIFRAKINTPVIYTWLEGHGIGGHAAAVFPKHESGCLECCYMDASQIPTRMALHSNMNFLEPNQPTAKSVGGCGNLFLPYPSVDASQTANMVSRLALDILHDNRRASVRISWKGEDRHVIAEGLQITKRYNEISNLSDDENFVNPYCPCCQKPTIEATFFGYALTVHIMSSAMKVMAKYRQLERKSKEACGILIGRSDPDGRRLWIDSVTEPLPADSRWLAGYFMRDRGHQRTLDEAHKATKGEQNLIGTWHTHPEKDPSPSNPDRKHWKKHLRMNKALEQQCFIIIGTEKIQIFVKQGDIFKPLIRRKL